MTIGSGGTILSNVGTDQVPTDNAWLTQSLDDPWMCSGGTIPTAGVLTGVVVKLPPGGGLISNVEFYITAAGATLTVGQCFACIHDDASGALLASGDCSAGGTLDAIGKKKIPMSVPFSRGLFTGPLRVSMFWNGTTGPTLLRGSSVSGGAANMGRTTPRSFTADGGLTTVVPAVMGAQTNNAPCYFFALS